jgi:hypothetical protein
VKHSAEFPAEFVDAQTSDFVDFECVSTITLTSLLALILIAYELIFYSLSVRYDRVQLTDLFLLIKMIKAISVQTMTV